MPIAPSVAPTSLADHYCQLRDEILSRAERLGWKLTRTRKGYIRAQAPRNLDSAMQRSTVVWPNTPSGSRTALNKRKEMERIDPRLRVSRNRRKMAG